MDRLQQLRGDAGGSQDSTLNSSSLPNESFMTANDSSKYFSLSESDSFNSSIKDLPPSTSIQDDTDNVIPNLSPIGIKTAPESYKIGKQIEAANILSGGVNIFDDNDNSYDGNELVIDDNVIETDDKSNSDLKSLESTDLKDEDGLVDSSLVTIETALENTTGTLHVHGKTVAAINLGNGLYLYRNEGEKELCALQLIDDDQQQQSIKYLKVRNNAEGNIEVYEEIQIKVPNEQPNKISKPSTKSSGQVPINKVINETNSNKSTEDISNKASKQEESKSSETVEPKLENNDTIPDQKFNLKLKMKNSESKNSPLSFTTMTYHSTHKKDGVPLTKTMVDMQLQPSRSSDNVKKTIEVHTESCKQKQIELPSKLTESLPNSSQEIKMTEISSPENVKNTNSSATESKISSVESKTSYSRTILNEPKTTLIGPSAPIPVTQHEKIIKEMSKSDPTVVPKEKNDIESILLPVQEHQINTKSDIESCAKTANESSAITNTTKNNEQKPDKESDSKNMGQKMELSKMEKIENTTKTVPKTSASESKSIDSSSATDDVKVDMDLVQKKVETILEKLPPVPEPNTPCQEKPQSDTQSQPKIINNDVPVSKQTTHIPINAMNDLKPPVIRNTTFINKEPVETQIVDKKESASANIFVDNKEIQSKYEDNENNLQKSLTINIIPKLVTQQTNDNQNIDANLANTKASSVNQTPNDLGQTIDKKEVLPSVKTTNVEAKPLNNNTPVPFGKWTEVNRQAFLNKIKESKIPTTSSTTQQLKQPNDLNRRDVLKKIDSQRQSAVIAAAAKAQEQISKGNIKNENAFSSMKSIPQEKNIVSVEEASDTKSNVQKTYSSRDKQQTPTKPEPQDSTKNKLQDLKKYHSNEPNKGLPHHSSKNKPQNYNKNKQQESAVSSTESTNTKAEQRKDINNQDLIDRTIEDMLNKPILPAKHDSDQSTIEIPDSKNVSVEGINTITLRKEEAQEDETDVLDAVEKKMNELHGIPFVERPPHELPRLQNQGKLKHTKLNLDITTKQKSKCAKINTVPPLLPFTKKHSVNDSVIEINEDEIIEHEPITGDIGLGSIIHAKIKEKTNIETKNNSLSTDKDVIITEKDFDKFARRNSKTYEDQLTVNFGAKQQLNVVQTIVEKGIPKVKYAQYPNAYSAAHIQKQRNVDISKIRLNSNLPNNVINKNYSTNSKLQHAYHMTMNAKMKKNEPITIIEDKPVQVVFMESNQEFVPNQLNVQGAQLSPGKRAETDALNLSSCDSLDSDIIDAIDSVKPQDYKSKSKHQRKQVLTPVENPDLELIEPRDLGVHESPKKKRKLDMKSESQKDIKVVPKKTYLLGRTEVESSSDQMQNATTDHTPKETTLIIPNHKSAASAIDSLVKAAELLETQQKNITNKLSSAEENNTPVKRGRGRPRKNPLPEGVTVPTKSPSPQKKPRLTESKTSKSESDSEDDDATTDDEMIKENWTMGKINENIVCPICNKLFRSENVVFKHVKHCTGPSPSRSDSDKRSPRRLRRSYEYDLRTDDNSELTDTESEKSIPKATPKKRMSRDVEKSSEMNEVIVIEDTPVKEITKKDDKKPAPTASKTTYNTNNLVCEFCGKTFRQLSYLVSHKLQHTKEAANKLKKLPEQLKKSVFSCEVCKKEFRKLHHLVQHRIIHNPTSMPSRSLRKSSLEQVENKNKNQSSMSNENQSSKQSDDQSAGFRCEPCDKSFRKLHHLVEHRESHREKSSNTSQPTIEKPEPQHQCEICKKSFKRLEQLVEHKDQHLETSSEKSDDRSVQSSLSRNIIHECSLCYMVFPNEHSLNKHTIICLRKKRQSASKQAKKPEESTNVIKDENSQVKDETKDTAQESVDRAVETQKPPPEIKVNEVVIEKSKVEEPKEKLPVKQLRKSKTPDISEPKPVLKEPVPNITIPKKQEEKPVVKPETRKFTSTLPPQNLKKTDNKPALKVNENKRKTPVKDRMPPTVTKRKKSTNIPLQSMPENPKTSEASDDDEIRYMLNPDFKLDENVTEGKQFMKIRANKRSSLQLERPNSKDLTNRRTSLQHPPKIPRLKAKPVLPPPATIAVAKPSKPDPVPSTDSDDSDVKYSFPETRSNVPEKKTPRKSLAQKRKTLGAIAKRKSSGQIIAKAAAAPAATRPIKRRTLGVEHRCDCGQLFSSAALLSRHTVLAHTPPRVRRRRSPPPSERKKQETKPNKANRTPAHKNVPIPDKLKKLIEKSKK